MVTILQFQNNARRDNLNGFWSDVYGTQHGVMVVNSFYENVPLHLFEKRALGEVEKEQNLVLHFNPQPPQEMLGPRPLFFRGRYE